LPGLSLNCDPPDLCLLSSQDYRWKPPVPGIWEQSLFQNSLPLSIKIS
jgi:hypothetical protein